MRSRIHDQKGMYFLTFTIVDWIDLFTRPVYAEILLDSMKFCQAKKGLVIYAYVIMPSHLHLIFQSQGELGLSKVIQHLRSYTARQIVDYAKNWAQPESRREWLLDKFAFNARKNSTNSDHQVWKKGSYPVHLHSPKMTRQTLNYIHQNPVKARIVKWPEHYVFSSASNYENGEGVMEVTLLENIWDDMGYIDLS